MMGGRGGPSRQSGQSAGSAAQTAAPGSLQQQVLNAIEDIVTERGTNNTWAKIADIRERIGGTREQQDAAFTEISNSKLVVTIPEENQKTLTQRDRAQAFRYGGEPNHLMHLA